MLDYWVVFAFVVLFFGIPSLAIWWLYRDHVVVSARQYKTFVPRFCASWIDGLILMPVYILFAVILDPRVSSLWDLALWQLALVLVVDRTGPWFYSILMHGRWGQTVGKMTTRVKVVDAVTEEPISYKRAFLRDCVPILILFPLIIYSLYRLLTGSVYSMPQASSDYSALANIVDWTELITGVWWFAEIVTMLTNEKRRAVHDFIAGTVVVRMNVEEDECQT